KSHCGRDRNGTSQVCNERWRDCTKRSGFWPRVAHTFRAASFRTWRSRRLALKFERVHHSRGTQRYGDGEMVTSLARSVTNDHFETERVALANAPDLDHGDLLVKNWRAGGAR